MVLLTDICLACRQALLGHGDTVYLFAIENNFSFENLLDIALSRNSTDQNGVSCHGSFLLTDICLASRQVPLRHVKLSLQMKIEHLFLTNLKSVSEIRNCFPERMNGLSPQNYISR